MLIRMDREKLAITLICRVALLLNSLCIGWGLPDRWNVDEQVPAGERATMLYRFIERGVSGYELAQTFAYTCPIIRIYHRTRNA